MDLPENLPEYHILNEYKVPLPVEEEEWSQWSEAMGNDGVAVNQEYINHRAGTLWVSTVFHGEQSELWETVVYLEYDLDCPPTDEDHWRPIFGLRVPTYELALEAHRNAVLFLLLY